MKKPAKALGVMAASAGLLLASMAGASAQRPDKTYFSGTGGGTFTNLCGFPIDVSVQNSGFYTDFYKDGNHIRTQAHVTEQDTFTANGTTLVGRPYRSMGKLVFSASGDLLEFHIHGVLEKVKLPDGSLFIAAGQIDVLAAGFGFVVNPDSGVTKNLDAFCAALSG
jgi:hypothetical protein